MPAPVFFSHPSSLRHDTGPHPEQPARIPAVIDALAAAGWYGLERREAPQAASEALHAVHPPAYLDELEAACARGGGMLDADTVVSEGSWEAALHSAGGACALVDALLGEGAPWGFSCHRPPGHHALSGRAMGFCLLANAAIAARHAIRAHGAGRVMILDWDVHHGNGTNDILHADPDVLFISIHESPLYPGTGPAEDVGHGAGEGFTVNIPVPGGSGDARFRSLVDHVAVPLLQAFEPGLLLISAGYDAHRDDPLAGCEVTEDGYGAMAASLARACAIARVPLGVLLEGGYALGALGASASATCAAISDPEAGMLEEPALDPLAAAARERLARWWKLP